MIRAKAVRDSAAIAAALPLLLLTGGARSTAAPAGPRFAISFPSARSAQPLDGRVLLMVSADSSAEPRFQIDLSQRTQVIFGIDVDGLKPGAEAIVDGSVEGYPVSRLSDIPAGTYRVQALINRYETFRRSDGNVVKLPPDQGEGQQWNLKPGNLYSMPRTITFDPRRTETVRLSMDQEIPPIEDLPNTKYVRREWMQSRLLTDFWGRPVRLGAQVLLPEGFDTHPNARYPLVVFHGHYPHDLFVWRETPPDSSVPCEYSERFRLECYNRTVQQYGYQLYKDWTGPGFPRVIMIEIQHATPYYDDSYAVNSENNGPYGDAIMRELIPYIERKYRGIGEGYARFTFGGSTGGWEALAVQVFYPDEFNGSWIACPDPIDFRAYGTVNIYDDANGYYQDSRWRRTPRAGLRDYLGHVTYTVEEENQFERVIASHGRSGGQWDIWQAVFSPVGADGYPAPIWDKMTGVIDKRVAEYWREHYDLSYIMRRDWKTLGPRLEGKLHIYVGDLDNLYLNNAVHLTEAFLESTTHPYYGGVVDYGDEAEHCWNGDHTRGNGFARLRYAQMFIPRIMQQIRMNHPANPDTTSWRY